ncbi:MAG: dipicolinate synthase subunit DpsA [Halanaerobiaceae bacterium]|nr:dipicolinate synthase subunit DpsA [Halanaerobiaceae bacterium]
MGGGRKIKIAVIGGDRREEVLVEILAERGFKLSVLSDRPLKGPGLFISSNIEQVVRNADVVIAPMSSTDEEGYLKNTFVEERIQLNSGFFNLLNKNVLFLIGFANPLLKKILEDNGINYIELSRLDDLAILNAIPTAEAAIKIAIEETDITLASSNILVYGLGKVGLSLAWRLKALGANTFAVTRDGAAIARGKDLGIEMLTYDSVKTYLPDMDIIFNTVPALVIDKESIALLKEAALIIDLASSPGGTDFSAARERGIKAILAPGLPGKTAPVTAGKILADLIPDLINSYSGLNH